MEVWAVVVAGGSGRRFGTPKQYAHLGGRPVLAWSLDTAAAVCAGVVLVLPAADVGSVAPGRTWAADVLVAGGATRSASVRAGLAAVPPGVEVVAVHDAARPLAPPALWKAAIDAVRGGADGAIPVVAVTDTIKEVGAGGRLRTLDRARLVAVQTPQVFRASLLRAAHAASPEASDDSALVEAAGGRVVTVPGWSENLKITTPEDLAVAGLLVDRQDRR